MKKYLSLILLFSFFCSTAFSQQKLNEEKISQEQKIYGLFKIWSEVKFGYPYPEKLKKINWEQRVLEYISKVKTTKNLEEYYYMLMEFVTLLEDSHTYVLPPWGYFKPGFDMPPIELLIIHDKVYMKNIGNAREVVDLNLKVGTEILEIDNTPVLDYFKNNVLRYYSQGSKQSNETILPLYLLYGPSENKIKLKISDDKGKIDEVLLSRNSKCMDGSVFMYKFVYNIFVAKDISVKKLKNDILYVRIPSFENEQIANNFKQLIDTLNNSKIKGLILDVRDNMGGSSENSKKVIECLIDKPVTLPVMNYQVYNAAYKAWGQPTEWRSDTITIYPKEGKKYLGKLVVLTNAVTASSAEDLVVGLKQTGRVMVVGQKTSGGAGNAISFKLPGGGTFQLSTFKATLPDGTEYIGKGIKPDIEIELNQKDISRKSDRTLNAAIKHFK